MRAGVALIVATAPLMGVGLVIGNVFQSIDWMVHPFGVADAILFTLILGAVCANVIRAAGVPES